MRLCASNMFKNFKAFSKPFLSSRSLSTLSRPISSSSSSSSSTLGLVLLGCVLSGAATAAWGSQRVHAAAPPTVAMKPAPEGGWPRYTSADVAAHRTAESLWVTYDGGVYDVTSWLPLHPGGPQKLMMAAGGDIGVFWRMYPQHGAQARAILEQYKIGILEGAAVTSTATADPYADEPRRHPALNAVCEKPYNAEPPLSVLAASYITPQELFFVRNHMPVPHIDVASYKLRVEGEGLAAKQYSLEQLQTLFPQHCVTASIQCAGSRRAQLAEHRAIKGLGWGPGAIGTAKWCGARLSDVLAAGAIGIQSGHVHFVGKDADPSGLTYEASIPLEKAMSPSGDVVLAYSMNDEPLSLDHGAPLRVIAPGIVGARQVKWLGTVRTHRDESEGHWQQRDYKSFSPSIDWDNVDWRSAPAIQDLPVTSAICEPSNGAVLPHDTDEVEVKGYAWSGGGRGVIRVDVSADGGASWHTASLKPKPSSEPQTQYNRAWAWNLWEATVPLPKGDKVEIVCKAVDSAYNNQPERGEHIWNLRGCAANPWHRVQLTVKQPQTTNKQP